MRAGADSANRTTLSRFPLSRASSRVDSGASRQTAASGRAAEHALTPHRRADGTRAPKLRAPVQTAAVHGAGSTDGARPRTGAMPRRARLRRAIPGPSGASERRQNRSPAPFRDQFPGPGWTLAFRGDSRAPGRRWIGEPECNCQSSPQDV